MKKAVIAVTMGDPAGIGPEIIVKALAAGLTAAQALPIVIGDAKVLQLAMDSTGAQLSINKITRPAEALNQAGILNLIDLDNVKMDEFRWGEVNAGCGQAAFAYIEKSITLAMSGEVD